MAQLEYGDFYKFVASAGIALIAGAVGVPWLFLREPFDLNVDTSKLRTLTPIAQSAVMHRQLLVAHVLPWLPWFPLVVAILGLALATWGLERWHGRQKIRDRGEDAATKKAEHELRQMSTKEVEARARQELESVEEPSQAIGPAEHVPAPVNSVNAYLRAERALYAKVSDCLGPNVHVETNMRAGNVEYDAIVRLGSGERVILEIKYIRKGFNYGWLAESVQGLTAKTALYAAKFARTSHVRSVLIIVLASRNDIFVEKIEQFKRRLLSDRRRSSSDVKIHCLAEDDIAALTCHQVRLMFEAGAETTSRGHGNPDHT